MSNIRYIKPFYKPRKVQEDLRDDSIILFSANMTATFYRYEKRYMTKKEIDKQVKNFYDCLILHNNLE